MHLYGKKLALISTLPNSDQDLQPASSRSSLVFGNQVIDNSLRKDVTCGFIYNERKKIILKQQDHLIILMWNKNI